MIVYFLEFLLMFFLILSCIFYFYDSFSLEKKKYIFFSFLLSGLILLRNPNLNPFSIFPETFFNGIISYNLFLFFILDVVFIIKICKVKYKKTLSDLHIKVLYSLIVSISVLLLAYLNNTLNFKLYFLDYPYLQKVIIIITTILIFDNFFLKNKNRFIFKSIYSNMELLVKKEYYIPILFGLVCFFVSYEYISYMGSLATNLAAQSPTTDQVLNILPKIDTSYMHVQIFVLFKYLFFISLIFFVRYIPFILFSSVTLSILRATFVPMTNIGFPEGQPLIDSNYTFGGDLFFSGHTAIPFLWALIFWDNKYLRYFFFLSSFVFGLSALLGRFHYSIDVFSAPFFAYCVYAFSKSIFPEYFSYTQLDK